MKLAFGGKLPNVGTNVFIAPNAAIIGDVIVGDHSSIWFSATIRGDYGPIEIGEGCSIQDGAVIHVNHTENGDIFPTIIGADCVIGHGAVVEGCTIGDGCLIGMNAVVLPRAKLGRGCIVAAGAVVREGDIVPEFSLVAGTPATIKRTFEAPRRDLAWAAMEYRSLGKKYLMEHGL